jgi:hypothetical protein
MQQPSAGPQPSGPQPTGPQQTPGVPTVAAETVTRPDPGLGRGRWEAPAWAFWVVLAVILASSAAYLLRRLGLLRLKSEGGKGPSGS